MSSQLRENNSELENPLKERIKKLMTEDELKKPYSFATRVGLSKGTFTGIWVEGRQTLHQKTIDKIVTATGADRIWLMTGSHLENTQQELPKVKVRTMQVQMSFNQALRIAYSATEGALTQTFSMMPPDQKADFLVQYMKSIYKKDDFSNEKALVCAIFTIEASLHESRQQMSLDDKIGLILSVYEIYYSNSEVLKTASIELEQYRHKENRQ